MSAMMKPVEVEDGGPVTLGDLTEKQASFVRHLVSGVKQGKAAELAGYAFPEQAGVHLVRLPHIQAAIRHESSRILMTEGVANSLAFMVKGPSNEKLPGAVRFQCAKWVMENAGHGLAAQRAALGLPDDDKPIHEMSTTELDGLIVAMRNRLLEARNSASALVVGDVQVIEHKGDHDK